jgi:nucleotide-binding universal stress UspA family protein
LEDNKMTENKVIACIDGTEVSTAVSDYAAWSSLRLSVPLMLLHVLDRSVYPMTNDYSGNIGLGSREHLLQELAELDERRSSLALEQGRSMLEDAKQRVIADGVDNPQLHQRHGDLLESLLTLEAESRLLVIGKHDENLSAHVGSRLETLVRSIHRPILVCPPAYKAPERIMIAYDGSNTTQKVVEMVAGSPLFRDIPCHLVMVGVDNVTHQRQLDEAKAKLEAKGFEVIAALIQGDVEKSLCEYRDANQIDILVMGAYGHSIIRRFLVGSTTTGLLLKSQIPVLLLR